MVQMIEVTSSNIHSIGYDRNRSEIYVKFHNDGVRLYKYLRVPRLVWTCFKAADSKRRFLQEYVIPYFNVVQVGVGNQLSQKMISDRIQ